MLDLRRIKEAEVTPEMRTEAVRILAQYRAKPLGTRIAFTSNGHDWTAVLERHWNEVKGSHMGVSLFEEIPVQAPIDVGPTGPFVLGARSLKNLVGVDQRLVDVVRRAIEITPIDFTVLEGLRTKERQAELVAAGKSQTLNSRHLTGDAVDLAPWVHGAVSWAWPDFNRLAPAIKAAANECRVAVQWGGNWPSFPDGPHWQLPFGA
jgi:hypothetical protein